MERKVRVGITLGDPQGIGPEVSAKALTHHDYNATFDIYGSNTSFEEACIIGNLNPTYSSFNNFEGPVAALRVAAKDILNGKLDVLVTAPLNKESARSEQPNFIGHTEYLAELSSIKKATMMFVSNDLRVSLVTTHIPLKEVSHTLNEELLSNTILNTNSALKNWWKIKYPKIALCGVNPHAGENGLFGNEEYVILKPVMQKFNSNGFNIIGPFGADTILVPNRRKEYDAVVSIFHDQLLPAIKLNTNAVNLTLGLPFIRTSVDHGVGYDIYGKNIATPQSMIAAIELGIKLSQSENK